MIYRHLYFGYYEKKNITVSENVFYFAISYYKDKVFIYIETENKEFDISEIKGDLKLFPDNKYLAEMCMIFSYSPSDNLTEWKRKVNKNSVFEIIYLKYEKIPEYVFYHYKMQHEGCDSYDKYGSIFLYGNMLIMYLETPREEGKSHNRILPENNLPGYKGDIIQDCYIGWDDFDGFWKEI